MIWFIFFSPRDEQNYSKRDAVLHRRLRLIGIGVLTTGLLAAALVYWNRRAAPEEARDIVGYEVGPGYSYPIKAANSRRYNDQLERVGGKAGVFAVEVTAWYDDRWRGKNLAPTLAVLAVVGFLGCFYLARVTTVPDHRP